MPFYFSKVRLASVILFGKWSHEGRSSCLFVVLKITVVVIMRIVLVVVVEVVIVVIAIIKSDKMIT